MLSLEGVALTLKRKVRPVPALASVEVVVEVVNLFRPREMGIARDAGLHEGVVDQRAVERRRPALCCADQDEVRQKPSAAWVASGYCRASAYPRRTAPYAGWGSEARSRASTRGRTAAGTEARDDRALHDLGWVERTGCEAQDPVVDHEQKRNVIGTEVDGERGEQCRHCKDDEGCFARRRERPNAWRMPACNANKSSAGAARSTISNTGSAAA